MATPAVETEKVKPLEEIDLEDYPFEEIELIEDESQAPDTDDIEELRRYWDTHAATEYNTEPVPIEEWPVKGSVRMYVSVHIKRENVYKLAELAKSEGIGSVRMAEKLLNRAIAEAAGG